MSAKKLAVIGAGLAGMAAAAAARQAGMDVTMIGCREGATAFSSGALDLAGDPFAPREHPADTCRDTRLNLVNLLGRRPHHPYALFGPDPDQAADAVLAAAREALELLLPAGAALALEGSCSQNEPCFTSLGTVKFTAFFPAACARPGGPGMEKPLALGFEGLSDFDPETWGHVAREVAGRLGRRCDAVTGWGRFGAGHQRPSTVVAAEIGRDPAAFIAAVKEAAAGQAASALVLPPVLPLGARAEILRELAAGLGMPVYEPLSLPPSVPGLRLAEHLRARAEALGVTVMRAEVTAYTAEGDRLLALTVGRGPDSVSVSADAFVLAAGKFLGGGLQKGAAFYETLFGLPVYWGDRLLGEVFTEKLLGLNVEDEHALFEVGLRTDARLRPLTADGAPRFTNLFAAGSILAGSNYILDGSGAGTALATGLRAAHLLATDGTTNVQHL